MTRVLVVSIAILLLGVFSANAQNQTQPADQKTFMGTQLCSNCHLDIYQTFRKSAHGIGKDPRTPEGKEGCENCHGAGSEHAISAGGKGVGDLIVFSAKGDIGKQNEVCLNCHNQGAVSLWHSNIHESKKLACVSCHKIHSTNTHLLTAASETDTCGGCHQDILAQVQRTSHHPLREAKINCSDCHNPHGTTTEKLISANSINEKCYECHAEKRGPFLWEHPPARENCLNCHQPHGSAHENLLNARLPYLCQRCHSNSAHAGVLYAFPPGVNPDTVYSQRLLGLLPLSQMDYRSCSNCHVNVHGSNHPSGTFWHR
jgi:DmsE family decaheme c-type cytochrome